MADASSATPLHHRRVPTTASRFLSAGAAFRSLLGRGCWWLVGAWMLVGCASTASSLTTPPPTPASPATSAVDRAPTVAVRSWAVYDASTGEMLASNDADRRLAVGSLIKLLNAAVAYDAGDAQTTVVAPDGLRVDVDESVIGIGVGQVISREVLIRAMLKVSANDAARLLALDIGGSEQRYAELMNDAAQALGLTNTHAVNATGLDASGQYSSANDLISLGVHLLRNPAFEQTVSEPTAVFNGQSIPNTNDLLGAYAGADGIKTGHTSDAGWCLLASATRHDRRVVVVVLGADSEAGRDDAARTLLDWGFAQS